MHNCLRLLGKSVALLILSIIAGLGLLLIVFLLPTEPIRGHLTGSLSIMEREGDYPRTIDPASELGMLDNFTDAIMLSNAVYDAKDKSLLDRTLSVYRFDMENQASTVVLKNYVTQKTEGGDETSYSRYWHGYLVFLKPLLSLFSYGEIREINFVLQSVLILSVICMLFRRGLSHCVIPCFIGILFLLPCITWMSLQFSTVFYITLFSLLAMLLFAIFSIKDSVCRFFSC